MRRINHWKTIFATTIAVGLAALTCQGGLTHRYSFNDPNNPGLDSVGSADATLMNGAAISTGYLSSPETVGKSGVYLGSYMYPAGEADGDYVTLPTNVLAGARNLSIEFWADLGDYWSGEGPGSWPHLFDFGDPYTMPGKSLNYLMYTPNSWYDSEAMFFTDHTDSVASYPLPLQGYHHVVVTVDSQEGTLGLFVDGVLASQVATSCRVTNIATRAMWLGRSQWYWDTYMLGFIDEFRIYDHALSSVEAFGDYMAGSDDYTADPSSSLGNVLAVTLTPVSVVEKSTAKTSATADFEYVSGLSLLNTPGFVFASSDTSVATIDQHGNIQALKPGYTTISGTYRNVNGSFDLIVQPDTTPATLVRVDTLGYNRFLEVTFSKPVDVASAQNLANYTIDQAVTVNRAALSADGTVVSLWTTPFDPSQSYTLTVNGVKDTDCVPNIVDHATIQFGTAPGNPLLARFYFQSDGYTVSSIADAMSIPGFPDAGGETIACSNPGLSDGSPFGGRNYYVEVIQGWLLPPTDGPYTFAMASDDAGQFYLSSDDTEAGLSATPLLEQFGWRPAQQYSGTPMPTVELTGGQKYFFRAIHQQGNGGDSFDVTWQKPGDDPIADGQPAIGPEYLESTQLHPRGLVITAQPQDITVDQNQDAVFAVSVDSLPAYASVQWYRRNPGGTAVPVNGVGLTFTAAAASLSDSGAEFWAVVSNYVDTVTTRAAKLVVMPDTIAPQLVSASAGLQIGPAATNLTVYFSEPLDVNTVLQLKNYAVVGPSSPLISSIRFDSLSRKVVYLELGNPLLENGLYTLSVDNVRDLAGNRVDPAHRAVAFYTATWGNPGQFVIQIHDNYRSGIDSILSQVSQLPPTRQLVYSDMGTTETEHGDNFAGIAEGLIIAPETGDYTFEMNSDDNSRFFLSTDESSANLSPDPICGIDGYGYGLDMWYGGVFRGSIPYQSPTVHLEQGMRYYYRVTWVEGTDSDYLQVGWLTPSNPYWPTVIPGSALLSAGVAAAVYPPPSAGSLEVTTAQNTAATLSAVKLSNRGTSGSGGALTVKSVSAQSTQGGAVKLAGTTITYTPPKDFVGSDSFSYTLFDGVAYAQGNIPVTVTSQKAPARNTLSIVALKDNTFVEFLGIPGVSYVIQSADSVAGPWNDLSGVIKAGPTGLITFTDAHPYSPKFYRTRVQQ